MNFTKLAFNPLGRMNEIVRYSSVCQETNETLAEHVSEVSMMSYLIVKTISSMTHNTETFDIGLLLEKCLLHDADEVITGDIPRNTKYATNEAHMQLNKVAEDAVEMIEKSLDCVVDLKSVTEKAKEGKEGFILKICDMLVVVKKAITEVELRGNLSFLKVVTELKGHLTRMSEILKSEEVAQTFTVPESVDYLSSLVEQAKDEITTICVKYNHVIDKYMIYENVIRGEG